VIEDEAAGAALKVRRLLVALALAEVLTACASEQPQSTDLVKDGPSAIERVKKECVENADTNAHQSLGWRTELKRGQWHVWLGGRRDECHLVEGYVRAADGDTACTVCMS
jgi:hypothetical protein